MESATKISQKDLDVSEIVLKPHYIVAKRSRKYHIRLNLERNGEIISLRKYQKGDNLYQLRYNIRKDFLKLYVYTIIMEEDKLVAQKEEEYKISCINDIYLLPICEKVKSETFKFYRKHQ